MIVDIFEKIAPKFKIIKLAKLLRFNPQLFFDFLIYHMSKLFSNRVDDNLIVLGGYNGRAFIGNPKYLYFYLKENTDYKLFFFVKSLDLKRELNKKGINAIYAFSLKSLKILRKSRAIFISHGFGDILPFKKAPRTVVIQTWHGGDLKIIGGHPYYSKFFYSKKARLLGLKLHESMFSDYFLNPSGEQRPLQIQADIFKVPQSRILSLGYPRNDIFFSNVPNQTKKLKNYYKIPDATKKIFLYAPTYREKFISKDPFNDNELVELNNFCKEQDYLFLIKAHFNEEILTLKNLENIKVIEKGADTQELLLLTDVLITDYSSIYFDYLLLNRPIILYTYDYEEYVSKRGIFYDHLEEIAPGPIAYNFKEFMKKLHNISRINKEYELKRLKLKKYFNKFDNGNSSERLLKFLKLI